MTKLARLGLALSIGLGAVVPASASPVGMWEIEMRDSRYDVTLCGDGTQLCPELVWLGNGADNAENLPYMNTLLIDPLRSSLGIHAAFVTVGWVFVGLAVLAWTGALRALASPDAPAGHARSQSSAQLSKGLHVD